MRKVNIAAYGKRILPHYRWAMDGPLFYLVASPTRHIGGKDLGAMRGRKERVEFLA